MVVQQHALNDKTRVAIGKKQGVDGWVAPMTCYYNWSTYDYRLPNIDMMMHMCEDEGVMQFPTPCMTRPTSIASTAGRLRMGILRARPWTSPQTLEKCPLRRGCA